MDRTVSRRSEPSSRTALMGEQPNPWDRLQPQFLVHIASTCIDLQGFQRKKENHFAKISHFFPLQKMRKFPEIRNEKISRKNKGIFSKQYFRHLFFIS